MVEFILQTAQELDMVLHVAEIAHVHIGEGIYRLGIGVAKAPPTVTDAETRHGATDAREGQ